MVIGHSVGGSAFAHLEKESPNQKLISATYSAPVSPRKRLKQLKGNQGGKPVRLHLFGDVATYLDI